MKNILELKELHIHGLSPSHSTTPLHPLTACESRCQLCPWGWGQNTANTRLICKRFGKQGNGMAVLKVSLVCLCPWEADPASLPEVAACQHHPSLPVLWLQSPASHGHSLSCFSRCCWKGQSCSSEHPEGWMSIRQPHKLLSF